MSQLFIATYRTFCPVILFLCPKAIEVVTQHLAGGEDLTAALQHCSTYTSPAGMGLLAVCLLTFCLLSPSWSKDRFFSADEGIQLGFIVRIGETDNEHCWFLSSDDWNISMITKI